MTAATFTEHFTEAQDSTRLYARDYAASAEPAGRLPIVCLHGLTRNSRDFEQLAPWLAQQGRRVIVPDVRGRGQSASSPDPKRYVPAVYARDVRQQLGDLGIRRAVFIGTSMGGLITMTLALQRTRMVAAAALNDVGPEIAPEGLARIKAYLGAHGAIDTVDDAHDYVRRVTDGAMPNLTDADIAMIAARLFHMDGPSPVLAYDPAIAIPLATAKSAPKWMVWAMYRWLSRRPVLLIRGALSDILSREITTRMVRRPKTTFVEIPAVGHAPLLDEIEAREAIQAWLQNVP